jgi:hypothetical protein
MGAPTGNATVMGAPTAPVYDEALILMTQEVNNEHLPKKRPCNDIDERWAFYQGPYTKEQQHDMTHLITRNANNFTRWVSLFLKIPKK